MDAVRQEVVGDIRRDAESGRRVLDVGDDEIDPVVRDERADAAADELASRASDDVADEEQSGHPRSHGDDDHAAAALFDARQDDAQLSGGGDARVARLASNAPLMRTARANRP